MEDFYSLGILRAKPGKEQELVAVWQVLCDGFDQLDGPPSGPVTLIQSTTDPALHYTFAPWRSHEDVQVMRADPRTLEFFRQASELCSEVTPGIFRVVGRSVPGGDGR
jgi:hypothetical protein